METEHKTQLIERMQEDKKDWVIEVTNVEGGIRVITEFSSETDTFENVLHKVELDLMTNLHHEFTGPIEIRIKST